MIPATYPTVVSSGITKMVVYELSSVDGLTSWEDYIPVKEVGEEYSSNTYDNNGAIEVSSLESITGKSAWVDYIPVFVNSELATAWSTNANGYIPVKGTA